MFQLKFSWDQAALNNLVIDQNEALEVEVLFYNYGQEEGIPDQGTAWMYDIPEADDWKSNLPAVYLDTRFLDDDEEKSYAVGTAQPELLQADIEYFFWAKARPQDTSNQQGLWQINFQRGYWLYSENPWYREQRGDGAEWYVFNEENETTAKVKQYHKYDSAHYAPGSFTLDTNANYAKGFRYKETFPSISQKDWRKTRTGKVPRGGYKVYRFQVNSPGKYLVATSQHGSNYDTVLELYDQNFVQIKYNDDANGTRYSEIKHYFPQGDYYVVVRGFALREFQSYVHIEEDKSIEAVQKGAVRYFDLPKDGEKQYSYTATSAEYVTFTTEYWQLKGDTYLYLYDSRGNFLTSNDDGGEGLYSKISYYLKAGNTYIIKVKGFGGQAVKGKLRIQ